MACRRPGPAAVAAAADDGGSHHEAARPGPRSTTPAPIPDEAPHEGRQPERGGQEEVRAREPEEAECGTTFRPRCEPTGTGSRSMMSGCAPATRSVVEDGQLNGRQHHETTAVSGADVRRRHPGSHELAATRARRHTARTRDPPTGERVTVSWVDDGVEENDVICATGMSGRVLRFWSPLVVTAPPGVERRARDHVASPTGPCRALPGRLCETGGGARPVAHAHRRAASVSRRTVLPDRPDLDHLADEARRPRPPACRPRPRRRSHVRAGSWREVRRAEPP